MAIARSGASREQVTMISKALAFGLLGVGCVVAAAGGAFVAVRQNDTAERAALSAPALQQPSTQPEAGKPVSETEAIVAPKPEVAVPEPVELTPKRAERPRSRRAEAAPAPRSTRTVTPDRLPAPPAAPERSPAAVEAPVAPSLPVPRTA